MQLFSKIFLIFCTLNSCVFLGFSQRTYKPHSVLATGTWYKIAVASEGVYKINVPFLTSLGLPATISSSQIRVFGTKNFMLPEGNNAERIDDLEEIGISVQDDGDGLVNGSDYILFFSTGAHQWIADSGSKGFTHKKNLYSDKAYYYLSIGGIGKRINTPVAILSPSVTVTSFHERFFHELDSVNFLSSGKEWFGEEFSNIPGQSLSKSFIVPVSDAVIGSQVIITSNVVARSINTQSRFEVRLNNQSLQLLPVPAVSGGALEPFARQVQLSSNTALLQNNANLTFTYAGGSFNAQGWLNWFEVFYRRQLVFHQNKQLLFRDWNSVGNAVAEYVIAGGDAATQIWDVSNPLSPMKMNTSLANSSITFFNEAQSLHEYVAFSTTLLTPQAIGKVANQDLHHTTETEYLIITHPDFLVQAQRLAQFHRQRNSLRVIVVTAEQVFNEFSGGIADPAAIRDFVKMYYDKYKAAGSGSPEYLLLFGKASVDYKNRIPNNTNLVPCYQTINSLDPLSSYTSDDFFGFLDDGEDINSGFIINTLDIGIGRIPARSGEEAKNFVDKVETYHAAVSLGPWRNNVSFIADDEDGNLHLQDAEIITATAAATAPLFNLQKIYLDAYKQESGSAGGRYPDANEVINNSIASGTLIWNYSGHGGPQRLAEEVVLNGSIVAGFNNATRLPLFITATCDFAPYDQPTGTSLGEHLLIRPKTGAIALMTTTRVVFAYSNRILNNNYLQIALQRDSIGQYKSLGDAIRTTKNYTYQTSGDIVNNRKFTLLGDPAMTLGFPALQVVPTTVNGHDILIQPDTLSATERVQIEGEVRNNSGLLQTGFSGTVYLSLFDQPRNSTTLANDAASTAVPFQTATATLFKGKVTATGGKFSFHFKIPKDINYQYGRGKASLYAQDGVKDGAGSTNILIGGIATGSSSDATGPQITGFLNDDRFVNGSITANNPMLLIKLVDSSGINTGHAGIGHDIVATLDNNNQTYFVLNDFYESDLDSYQKGTVRFQLPQLTPGPHTLKIKAWDVVNNSSEIILEFIVVTSDELVLDHVLNYPNPFTTKTAFWFEHNMPGLDLKTRIEIFTVTGKLIKTLRQTINNIGNRSTDIEWNGRDEWGDKAGRGVYWYRLSVQNAFGKKATQLQRLVIL